MITIIKNVECYAPEYLGVKDICTAGEKIYKISDPGRIDLYGEDIHTIDGSGLLALPGIIDGHVHIIGGGGEEGFQSRIGEIDIRDILTAGVTTVVGLLGADDLTKSLYSLLAKAKALESERITTFIYSGSYAVPVITFSGDIGSDMVLIDKVIGAGEIAVSDHRSSHPDINHLLSLASKVHMAGLISGKAGILHLHLGDGKDGLAIVNELIQKSDLPVDLFFPTHVNRNPALFRQAIDYVKSGGNIDLTSGEEAGIPVPDAVERLISLGVDMQRVTVSSDANGSIPCGSVGKIQTLFDDIIDCIVKKGISPEAIFPLVTENAARRIKQYPRKGTLSEGSDADILILNRDYKIEKLFAMGDIVVDNGEINLSSLFERGVGEADGGSPRGELDSKIKQ